MTKNPAEIVLPKYKPGDLLVRKLRDGFWFDHLVILKTYRDLYEYVYEIYTSDELIETRIVEWVHDNYEEPKDETAQIHPEVDQKTV
jgi:hypothetical protein